MKNNKTFWNWLYYLGLIPLIIILGLSMFSNKRENLELVYYVAKVNSTIQDENYQNARLVLENSIFQNANDIILQNPKLTYSEALDKILPMRAIIATPQNGVLVVVQNRETSSIHNVQIEINLQVPMEKYKIITNGKASVVGEDGSKGFLKLNVDKINSMDEVTVAILLSNDYDVFLNAFRTESHLPLIPPTGSDNPMERIEFFAQQTAVATYNQANTRNLMKFEVVYDIDKIQPIISVHSDEAKSRVSKVDKNKIKEQELFIKIFLND